MEQLLKEVAVVLFSLVLTGAILGLPGWHMKKPGAERFKE